MLPCAICGKDAATGWIVGFAPAPDSQKMALCPLHDSPDNRRRILRAWKETIRREMANAARIAAYQAARIPLFLLTIYFSSGGSVSLPSLACEQTDHNTLKVHNQDGSVSFFPMQQVRRYDMAPLPEDMLVTEELEKEAAPPEEG